jgi:hypothetical protein
MDNYLTKRIQSKIKRLAYYQIAGGILGTCLTIWLIAKTVTITGLFLLIILFTLGLYAFAIYCGQQLLKGDIKKALTLSIINQCLQIISFIMFGYAYKYAAGLVLSIGVDLTESFKFTFDFAFTTFQFDINSDNENIAVGLNVLALYLIYFIDRLQEQVENSKKRFNEIQINEDTLYNE